MPGGIELSSIFSKIAVTDQKGRDRDFVLGEFKTKRSQLHRTMANVLSSYPHVPFSGLRVSHLRTTPVVEIPLNDVETVRLRLRDVSGGGMRIEQITGEDEDERDPASGRTLFEFSSPADLIDWGSKLIKPTRKGARKLDMASTLVDAIAVSLPSPVSQPATV